MKLPLVVIAALASVLAGCNCGALSPCDGIKCVAPLSCNPKTGACVLLGTGGGAGGGAGVGGGSGGGTAGGAGGGGGGGAVDSGSGCTANSGCGGLTPVCDTFANGGAGACVRCTLTDGCAGSTPFCDPNAAPSGACYQCRTFSDCSFNASCDQSSHTCVSGDAGSGGGGGSSDAGTVIFDDAGMTAHCLAFDGGAATSCTTECSRGFVCQGGVCVLRGSTGPIQVTLRFPVSEDLDLHVVEPLKPSGSCEIWYGSPNINPDAGIPFPFPFPIPMGCGALGWLDLDSNPACMLDNVNVENVIYPVNQPATQGTYTVRVDYYEHCSATAPVPYEVEVRANGGTRYYCGTFATNSSDNGSAGSGRTITKFVIP